MSDKDQKAYLTPKEVADLLMISPITVRQLSQQGELHSVTTPGGHRRFFMRDVEQFATERGITLHRHSGDDDIRVLIIDDDRKFADFLHTLLTSSIENVVIETSNDGYEAGVKTLEFEPHIVLLDLMMPGISGFKVCKYIKENSRTRHIRVLAMTGYPTPENCEKILAVGAESCLAKPVEKEILLDLVKAGRRSRQV